MLSVELVLLIISGLFAVSIFVSKAGARFGVPALLLFLFVGMVFGIDGLGIDFRNFTAAQAVGTFALCIILFSGGMDTRMSEIRPVARQGVVLATIGVLLTAIITGIFIWKFVEIFVPSIHLSLLESLLLASIMSSTDSASVFSILRSKGVLLKNNLKPLLELESGSNDPMAYMLTVTLIQLVMSDVPVGAVNVIVMLLVQLVVGGLAGYLFGKFTVKVMNKINLSNDALYPVLLLSCSILIFAVTYYLKGNGFLAVYVAGLVIGNSRFVLKNSSMKFFDGFAWLSQILLFLTLGLLVNPQDLLPVAIPSLIIAVFMIVVSRPLSVFLSLIPFKHSFKEKSFLSWVGLRGAVPIVFAMLPFVSGVPSAEVMFNIVFFVTLVSLLVQGTSLTFVADKLGLSGGAEVAKNGIKEFDFGFGEDIKSALTEITLTAKILEKGNKLLEIPFPENALVVMVKRNDRYFVPRGGTELEVGDVLLIITDDNKTLNDTYQAVGIGKA